MTNVQKEPVREWQRFQEHEEVPDRGIPKDKRAG